MERLIEDTQQSLNGNLAKEYGFPEDKVKESGVKEKISRIIPETRRGKIRSWSEMQAYLPDELGGGKAKFCRSYLKAQAELAGGRKTEADRIFDGLKKKKGYSEFEKTNRLLLAIIDIGAKGKTNQFAILTF